MVCGQASREDRHSREAVPIAVLLSDEYPPTVYAVAIALAAIGDRRTVAAMDVWLKTGNHRNYAELLAHVKKCRDELQQRLEKEQKAKPPGARVGVQPPSQPAQPATREEVIELLGGDATMQRRAALVKLGDRAFPVYAAILADPKSPSHHVHRALETITDVPGDRSQFLELAVQRLGDESWRVRLHAVCLLGEIGSVKDMAPAAVLLSDEFREVVAGAAHTLAALGDRRALAALNVWLKAGNHRDDEELLAFVKRHRDELRQRLDKEEKEKKPAK